MEVSKRRMAVIVIAAFILGGIVHPFSPASPPASPGPSDSVLTTEAILALARTPAPVSRPAQAAAQARTYKGIGRKSSKLFPLKAGGARFQSVCTNCSSNFVVQLLDSDGQIIDFTIANEIGPSDASTFINIAIDGNYALNVIADGSWTIVITQ